MSEQTDSLMPLVGVGCGRVKDHLGFTFSLIYYCMFRLRENSLF